MNRLSQMFHIKICALTSTRSETRPPNQIRPHVHVFYISVYLCFLTSDSLQTTSPTQDGSDILASFLLGER